MHRVTAAAVALITGAGLAGCGVFRPPAAMPDAASRAPLVRPAKVWLPTKVASMDLLAGPQNAGAFALEATVECTYRDRTFDGKSPKFACVLPGGDELKVKYAGPTNATGEVIGEVAATRLFWALGFGADAMYSVRVACRGCPAALGGRPEPDGVRVFDPAAVERRIPLKDLSEEWHWGEIDRIDEAAGGASRAERDAFTLLAAFVQHADSKPAQQRIVCAHEDAAGACRTPLVMVQDLGNTFGSGARGGGLSRMSVNLSRWSREPVWKETEGCVANLRGLRSATLNDPAIGEDGRKHLADLLMQLSDRQIHDMFTAARMHRRLRDPADVRSGFPTIDEWVAAFKARRAQIVDRRCGPRG